MSTAADVSVDDEVIADLTPRGESKRRAIILKEHGENHTHDYRVGIPGEDGTSGIRQINLPAHRVSPMG